MKLIRTRSDSGTSAEKKLPARHKWKLLVVDDEPDVRELTKLNLRDFRFAERELEIIEAGSAYEANALLREHADIAVALIDVVMETDDAGLRLVEFIRNELGNSLIRLIIRTGQPGLAPERYVIDNYDIDDYKDKTELTATRLYTTVRSAVKAYRELRTIELNRMGLQRVLMAAPDIYRLSNRSLQQFFQGVLTQVIGLCNLSDSSFIATTDGMIATIDEAEGNAYAVTDSLARDGRLENIRTLCAEAVTSGSMPEGLRKDSYMVPLEVNQKPEGFIYLEPTQDFQESDRQLIAMVAQQCSSALENLRLHINLADSHDHMINMLAHVAEYKDKVTGDHINRIDQYSRLVAQELGLSEEEAVAIGKASRLHDVGKVGIPDRILNKPGRLDDDEFAVIRGHTHIGANILEHDEHLHLAREIALNHHERWDGSGYPAGTPSRHCHLGTRIVSVVDVFDALISRRSYKEPWEPEAAIEEVDKGSGSHFDPTVVKAFLKLYRDGAIDHIIASAKKDAGLLR
jgi:response regulator RpfG family c-di-GMP phosphodiesterase